MSEPKLTPERLREIARAKHTPFPWRAENDETETPGMTFWNVVGPRGQIVAGGSYSTREADMRLIETIPSMLELLERRDAVIKQLVEALRVARNAVHVYNPQAQVLERCGAALAAAEALGVEEGQ